VEGILVEAYLLSGVVVAPTCQKLAGSLLVANPFPLSAQHHSIELDPVEASTALEDAPVVISSVEGPAAGTPLVLGAFQAALLSLAQLQ